MEITLAITLILSVITNLLFVNAFRQSRRPTEVTAVLETVGCSCGEELASELRGLLLPLIKEEPIKVPAIPDDSHNAWKNRVEEPIQAPPSPHGPPPKLEPLARPYGFSR